MRSHLATDIVASKYFRSAGVAKQVRSRLIAPNRLTGGQYGLPSRGTSSRDMSLLDVLANASVGLASYLRPRTRTSRAEAKMHSVAHSSVEDRINAEKANLLAKITEALGPNFSTVRAAKWMGRSRVHPLLLIRSGQLRAMKCGRVYIVAADDLADYLARCYVEAAVNAEAHRERRRPHARRRSSRRATARRT